ncbi:hypothetical protein ACFPT7_16675 [Acidicapsa dinghuensis]|uniref:Uncharacterized protein n=1 Tax=Acidicapsa dinghuensis TaxID=2218256 RepID=A0ABW1EJC6_9BACT|nr:hypothetical protein [Acidicapsa dinghuensis]
MIELNSRRASDGFPFQSSFFANPPFRSYFFVWDTLLLCATLAILGFVVIKYWSSLQAVSIFWLGLAGFCMITLWVMALRCYRRIHVILRNDEVSTVSEDSFLGVAISSAAGMIQWGLFFAYMMTAGVLMQLAVILSGR